MLDKYQVMFVVVNGDIHVFDNQTTQLAQPQNFFEKEFNLGCEQMLHLVCGIMTEDGILLLGPAYDSAPCLIDMSSSLLRRLCGIFYGYFRDFKGNVTIHGGRTLLRDGSNKVPSFLITIGENKGFPNISLSPERLCDIWPKQRSLRYVRGLCRLTKKLNAAQ